jgi:hypothetical protein
MTGSLSIAATSQTSPTSTTSTGDRIAATDVTISIHELRTFEHCDGVLSPTKHERLKGGLLRWLFYGPWSRRLELAEWPFRAVYSADDIFGASQGDACAVPWAGYIVVEADYGVGLAGAVARLYVWLPGCWLWAAGCVKCGGVRSIHGCHV